MKEYKKLEEVNLEFKQKNTAPNIKFIEDESESKGVFGKSFRKSNKKVIYRTTAAIDYKTLEDYLEKMASQGYMVVKITNAFITFRACEPIELDFNVGLFYKSMFGSVNNKEEMEYKKICIDSGWSFVYANDMMQVFYKLKEDQVIPIYTDEVEVYQTIKKIFLKTDVWYLLIIAMYLFINILNFTSLRYRNLYTNSGLFSLLWPVLIIVFFIVRVFIPVKWLFLNNLRLKKGLDLSFPGEVKRARVEMFYIVWLIVYLILFIASMTIGVNTYSNPTYIMVMGFLFAVVLTITMLLFAKYLRRIETAPIVRMIIFTVIMFVIGQVFFFSSVVAIFANNHVSENDMRQEASKYVLTLEEYGNNDLPNHISVTEESSILVKRYKYVESIFDDHNDDNADYIRIETLESNAEFIADYLVSNIVKVQKERFEHRYDSPESINVDNMVYEIEIEGLNVDHVYVLEEENRKLLIQKGKRVIVLESSYDLLDVQASIVYGGILQLN